MRRATGASDEYDQRVRAARLVFAKVQTPGSRGRLLRKRLGWIALSVLVVSCTPRVHVSEPLILEDQSRHEPTATPIETVEIPRIRTGIIARTRLDQTLDAGVGHFLSSVDVSPHLQDGRFAGWVVERFDSQWVDLLPGDIVKSVNGARIETPAQVQALWLQLTDAEQIQVSVIRAQAPFELRFTVEGH